MLDSECWCWILFGLLLLLLRFAVFGFDFGVVVFTYVVDFVC